MVGTNIQSDLIIFKATIMGIARFLGKSPHQFTWEHIIHMPFLILFISR